MLVKNMVIEEKELVVDVICDKCGKSCAPIVNSPGHPDHGKVDITYGIPHMNLQASWGYMSGHDTEAWSAQICEACAVELAKTIKFQITGPW